MNKKHLTASLVLENVTIMSKNRERISYKGRII